MNRTGGVNFTKMTEFRNRFLSFTRSYTVSHRKIPSLRGGTPVVKRLAQGVSKIVPFLIILSLLLAACGAADEPAASEEAAPAAEESAPAADDSSSSEAVAVTGPVLTDPPAGAGEREVQSEVYNTPADAGGIESYQEAPALAEMVASGDSAACRRTAADQSHRHQA